MLLPQFALLPALLFYLLYLMGVVVFVVVPAWAAPGPQAAAGRGALFGLIAYATYDLTNQATLVGWPWRVDAGRPVLGQLRHRGGGRRRLVGVAPAALKLAASSSAEAAVRRRKRRIRHAFPAHRQAGRFQNGAACRCLARCRPNPAVPLCPPRLLLPLLLLSMLLPARRAASRRASCWRWRAASSRGMPTTPPAPACRCRWPSCRPRSSASAARRGWSSGACAATRNTSTTGPWSWTPNASST